MTEPAHAGADWVEWDFTTGPNLVDTTGHGLHLEQPPTSEPIEYAPDQEVGGALRFDGGHHLVIPAAGVGPLNAARRGDHVSVLALLRRRGRSTGFVAGMWQEDDHDPRRQYGLFVSLPTYGGDQRVCGHVSSDGRPSESLPYSRDYAASLREIEIGRWQVAGFTYDGTRIRTYLDGTCDEYPTYTEPDPPLGLGWTYPKNPYDYPEGLNNRTVSDFTIGAVRLTAGMANHFIGDLARLVVTPSALSPAAVRSLSERWLISTEQQ